MENIPQYVTTGIDPKPSSNPFHGANPFHRRQQSRKSVGEVGIDSNPPKSSHVIPVIHRFGRGHGHGNPYGQEQVEEEAPNQIQSQPQDQGQGQSSTGQTTGQTNVPLDQQHHDHHHHNRHHRHHSSSVSVNSHTSASGNKAAQIPPSAPVSAVLPSSQLPSSPSVSTLNPYAPVPTSSSEEWKDRGAATIIKSETDAAGHTTTTLIKKGVKDFSFGQTLGEGSYSTVVAASDRQTLREYAIKVLDKRHIIKEKKVKYVNIEKNSLNRLGDHPGIIRLYYTFQDERSLYFVLDFAANGELLTLIKQMGSLDEDCTRYYGAQILDAVDFMHSKGVIHRDLKPENILLDYKMRIKITDFGTAKLLDLVKDENGNEVYPEEVRTTSFVGTAEYVSPELLTDKATDKRSDIWAFGCIIYQMIAGRPPFKASNEYQTFQKIVKLQYSYPPGFPYMVRDLVKQLLVLNPKNRLDLVKIKKHDFFSGVDWDRHNIWKKPPPRLMPYKSSAKSISNPRLTNPSNRLLPSQMKLVGNTPPSPGKQQARQGIPSGGVRASAAAAAALGKPLTRPQQQPPSSPKRNSPVPTSTPAQFVTRTNQPSSPAKPKPSVATLKATESLKALKRAQSQPVVPVVTTNYSQQKQRAPSTPSDLQPPPSRNGVQRTKTPEQKNSPTPPNASPRLIIPPVSQLDAEWSSLLTHHEERILKIGNLPVVSSGNINVYAEYEEDDKEPGLISKFFNGGASKRKRRIIIITSAARLLICGEDRRLRLEIPIALPQVSIRELPFNRKTNTGAFIVEAHHKFITIEDSSGTSEWMAAISKAKDYYQQATALSESNAATAATAAAIAVGGRPSARGRVASSSTVEGLVGGTGNRLINTNNSTFLQKSEERRSLRRRA